MKTGNMKKNTRPLWLNFPFPLEWGCTKICYFLNLKGHKKITKTATHKFIISEQVVAMLTTKETDHSRKIYASLSFYSFYTLSYLKGIGYRAGLINSAYTKWPKRDGFSFCNDSIIVALRRRFLIWLPAPVIALIARPFRRSIDG